MPKYKVAYRDRQGCVHLFRREYTSLLEAESAADDYKVGEPETEFWVEPICSD